MVLYLDNWHFPSPGFKFAIFFNPLLNRGKKSLNESNNATYTQ